MSQTEPNSTTVPIALLNTTNTTTTTTTSWTEQEYETLFYHYMYQDIKSFRDTSITSTTTSASSSHISEK